MNVKQITFAALFQITSLLNILKIHLFIKAYFYKNFTIPELIKTLLTS